MTTKTDAVPSTPAAQWRVAGEQDPHGTQYDCERAALTLGKLTDDELANGVFMNGDRPMDINRILARDPEYHAPIVWLTAAKERIRWLSRALERACAPASVQTDHIADEHGMVGGDVRPEAVQEAYQQFLDETQDAERPYARRALVACIAECQALSYSEDRGITVSEAESIGGVLHELRRLQNLEAEAVEVITTGAPTETARTDAFESLIAFHAEQLEANPYCYFELAYTRQTAWMAWITDRPAKGEPGTAEHAKSRKLIVRGQGETPFEACANALAALAASASSTGGQGMGR